MNKLSAIYGKRIYTKDSQFLGISNDVLIDPAEGAVKFLLKGDPHAVMRHETEEAKKYIKDNFIPFSRIRAMGDIVIIE